MRLTLRTLLAYLDGILDPKDAANLGKKIEESDFATNLVHRIRDVMRRLRLGAPSLEERGPGFDPNTVAEYLDNTLPTERVTDFEKVCLDSDVHLAEVAASHQILTLVLGEPAEVDPESRQRMYQLKDIQTSPKPPPPPDAGASVEPQGAQSEPLDLGIDADDDRFVRRRSRPKPTVPEYLRDPRKRPTWVPIAAAAVLVVCLTFVALQLLGQFEPGSPLGNQLVAWGLVKAKESKEVAAQPSSMPSSHQAAATPDSTKTPPLDATKPPAADEGKSPPPMPSNESQKTPTAEPLKPVAPPATEAPVTQPPKPAAPQPKAIQEDLPSRAPLSKPETAPGTPPVPSAMPGPQPDPNARPEVAPEPPASVKPSVPPGIAGIGKPSTPVTKTPDGATGIAKTDPANETPRAPDTDAAPLSPEPLGRLMSNDQILLVDDPAGGWTRVAANQVLLPRQLLVLPTYRPRVALSAVTLEIGGSTRFELLGPRNAQDPPGVGIFYGRMLMMPLARPGTKLRLAFGEHMGVVTFDDADAVVAVEVRRVRTPGTNPETESARVTATLFVATGSVGWQESVDGKLSEPRPIAASQRLTFDGPAVSTVTTVKEMPRWISQEPMSGLDRRASPAIGQALQIDRPARVSLLEIATSRPQKEVKWLSLRCLGYVNQFRDVVAALGDPAHKLEWPDYIDELRSAVNRDAETAAAVRMALEKQYSQQASQLYRMLWGYTDKDLEGGEDEKLVKALDDESLAIRVLAVWNLKDITGLGQYYQAEQSAARRQQAARRWRQRLDAKEIRLKSPEEKAGAAARERTSAPAPREGVSGAPRDAGPGFGARDGMPPTPGRGGSPITPPRETPSRETPPDDNLPPANDPMAPLPP